MAYASNIGRSFDWAGKPRLDVPDLPTPEHVVSLPCATGGADEQRSKEHDVLDMVTSGYLDRLGFDYRAATPADAFREPDKVVSTLVGSR